jgi:hypothetical protein
MSQSKLNTTRVVELLLHDALPALGERARAEVLRLAANYEQLAHEWIESGQSVEEAQRSFESAVVDGLQQAAHDLCWDSTWPACPRHGRHPLWYDEARQVWFCKHDATVIAPLGRLADLNLPAT